MPVDNFYSSIGALIKYEREKKGISQEIIGNKLNLTRASIINLEKGRHRPSIYQLLLIAEILQIDYTQLIPINTNQDIKPKKEILDDIEKAISDQDKLNKATKETVFNFLNSIKKA